MFCVPTYAKGASREIVFPTFKTVAPPPLLPGWNHESIIYIQPTNGRERGAIKSNLTQPPKKHPPRLDATDSVVHWVDVGAVWSADMNCDVTSSRNQTMSRALYVIALFCWKIKNSVNEWGTHLWTRCGSKKTFRANSMTMSITWTCACV